MEFPRDNIHQLLRRKKHIKRTTNLPLKIFVPQAHRNLSDTFWAKEKMDDDLRQLKGLKAT